MYVTRTPIAFLGDAARGFGAVVERARPRRGARRALDNAQRRALRPMTHCAAVETRGEGCSSMAVVHERLDGPDAWPDRTAGALGRPHGAAAAHGVGEPAGDAVRRSMLEALAAMPLAAGLDRSALRALADAGSLVRLARGDTAYAAGDAADTLYLVVCGKIQLWLPARDARSGDGGQRLLALVQPGDVFGQAEALLRRRRELTARAGEPTTLVVIERSRLEPALVRHPALAVALLRETSRWLHRLIGDLWRYGQDSAGRRLARYLLEHLVDMRGNAGRVHWTDRKAAVASQLSITPETLSRELGRLKSSTIVSEDAGEVVVHDIGRLRAVAADDAD